MVKWGAVILIVCFFLLFSSSASADMADEASLEFEFEGNDLKAVVSYDDPGSMNAPEPAYEWYGAGGRISEAAGSVLPRYNFRKGDTIICKYRDAANSIDLRESIEIPNFPPVLEDMEMITARQGKIVNIAPKASDIDGDGLFFTFSEPFDDEGRWEDTIEYDPGLYTATVTVSDGQEMVSKEAVINLTGEFDDTRRSILERRLEYEGEVEKAEAIRMRRETKKFSRSTPGQDLVFDIDSPEITLSKIVFNVKEEMLKYSIEVRGIPLSSRPREYEKAPGQVYQYVQASVLDAEDDDFSNISFRFRIEKDWFFDNSISPYSVKIYEYNEGWEYMGSARITRLDEHYGYDIRPGSLEGFYALSIDPDVGELLPSGAAVADDEQRIDFQILNEGDGDYSGSGSGEAGPDASGSSGSGQDAGKGSDIDQDIEGERRTEDEEGGFGIMFFAAIIAAIIVIGFFVFRRGGSSAPEIPGGTEDDKGTFSEAVDSRKQARKREKEMKKEEKKKLAEERRRMREEKRRQEEEELRRAEKEKERKRAEDEKTRLGQKRGREEQKRKRQEQEQERQEQEEQAAMKAGSRPEPEEASYENLSEAALIEERRRLARIEEEKLEREAMRRREAERIKKEEEERMTRRAKSGTRKKARKTDAEKKQQPAKKSNIKIISEDEWKDRMKRKKKEADEELTIERMDEDV